MTAEFSSTPLHNDTHIKKIPNRELLRGKSHIIMHDIHTVKIVFERSFSFLH